MNTAQKLNIVNKCSCYSEEENIIRKAIMDFTIENKRAFSLKKDIEKLFTKIRIDNLEKKLTLLKEHNGFVADEDGNVNFVYPVSALGTNHHVTLADGRRFSAMCAIDAMGTTFTFHQDVVVESVCSNTGKSVRVEIRDGKLYDFNPPTLHALHVDLNRHTDWASSC
ncbi:Alkylmercury lyase [Hathewaya proteolytica DSM 3090]|uniref:Alkylmercury lyase n=2 Tax=Hathewaya proteolytica TaxID=29365 RepID=A0A1M6PUN4_9CLOT|nr:Alkylmercury lyase [Hathewaya proteolytica DSM 3090]